MSNAAKTYLKNDFPILLDNPRAWRTYTGGWLLDRLHGTEDGENGNFPEEWIMSVVTARNAGREEYPDEGLSHVSGTELSLKELLEARPEYYLGPDHVRRYGASLGVLVKLIDSAERLTVQVHPSREKALELFNSPYGKTECWHILGGQEVNGEKPCIYLGFRQGISRAAWKDMFDRQDIPGMLQALERFEVSEGDTIMIEGGIPHAIGAGCFLMEIQEPTDFTVRVERITPVGLRIPDMMCHQGLGFERMFDCFDYTPYSREEIHERWFLKPQKLLQSRDAEISTLVGRRSTDIFRLDEVRVHDSCRLMNDEGAFFGLYVLEGSGSLSASDGREIRLEKGQQFFVPYAAKEVGIRAESGCPLRIMRFYGGSPNGSCQ